MYNIMHQTRADVQKDSENVQKQRQAGFQTTLAFFAIESLLGVQNAICHKEGRVVLWIELLLVRLVNINELLATTANSTFFFSCLCWWLHFLKRGKKETKKEGERLVSPTVTLSATVECSGC